MNTFRLSSIKKLEAESIYVLRETVACFNKPVILYSVSKDSAVIVRLIKKAFFPGECPIPLLYIKTGFEYPEMTEYRNNTVKKNTIKLSIQKSSEIDLQTGHSTQLGYEKCRNNFINRAFQDSVYRHGFNAIITGLRRDDGIFDTQSIFSILNKNCALQDGYQEPDFWHLYNTRKAEKESVAIFPLSNWSELDIWLYIKTEDIPIMPFYYAKKRKIFLYNTIYYPYEYYSIITGNSKGKDYKNDTETSMCRLRHSGCVPCSGFIKSNADSIDMIIKEEYSSVNG